MITDKNVKYDGSYEEMKRLELIDDAGIVNNKKRNEFNQYMARAWEHNHPCLPRQYSK